MQPWLPGPNLAPWRSDVSQGHDTRQAVVSTGLADATTNPIRISMGVAAGWLIAMGSENPMDDFR